jgi:hypothetical protein
VRITFLLGDAYGMGAAARATATHYDAAAIAGQWETLLTDLRTLRRLR